MPRKPEEKELVDAIIDSQVDAKKLVDEVVKEGASSVAKVVKEGLKKLNVLVREKRITAEKAKQLSYALFDAALLAEFAKSAQKVKDHVDKHHERKTKAARKRKGRVHEVAKVTKDDFLRRELEARGLLDEEGKLKEDDGGSTKK